MSDIETFSLNEIHLDVSLSLIGREKNSFILFNMIWKEGAIQLGLIGLISSLFVKNLECPYPGGEVKTALRWMNDDNQTTY